MKLVKKIDHIAIAVKDLEKSLKFYTDILNLKVMHRETISSQKVKVAFIEIEGLTIELMEPFDERCFVGNHIKKRGEGLAHICFEADDIEAVAEELDRRELVLLTRKPVKGCAGRKVIFIHPKDNAGTLTEFCQYVP